MISVEQALEHLFDLVAPLGTETVALRDACGRVLSQDVHAKRDQPPFDASSMDGYAVAGDVSVGDTFNVIGEAAAGHGLLGSIATGQAARIFTGAPLPTGATRVVIQENVQRKADTITITADVGAATYVRPSGADFRSGDIISAPRRLTPSDLALLAAMNVARVPVTHKPVVAIIPTGDELVQPGESPSSDQIIASNSFGLAAMIEAEGGTVRLLPIARDTIASLSTVFDMAQDADLVITIGGASVGDHDLVSQVAANKGMEQAFYKVAMRPGKPLMAGRLGTSAMIGLPGNPVSAMVCGHIFVLPVLRKMLGLAAKPAPRIKAQLANSLGPNGPREHYMRARLDGDQVTVFERQDSALLTVLSEANCLAVRVPNDGSRLPGDRLNVIKI